MIIQVKVFDVHAHVSRFDVGYGDVLCSVIVLKSDVGVLTSPGYS